MPSSEELAFLTSGCLSWAEFGVSSWRVVASLLAVVSVRCLQYVTSQAALVRPRMGASSLKVLPKASGTPWGANYQVSRKEGQNH